MSCWRDPTDKDAYCLSWVSVLFTIIATGIGFGFWKKLGSALCLLYGLESLIDLLSSLAVLWRFFNAKNNDTEEHHAMLEHREIRASTAISFILILLGIMVMAAAAYDSDESYNFADDGGSELKVVIALSFSSILVFGTLTMYKFHYASKLESKSLYKDGICSLIGTVISCGVFVNSIVVMNKPEIWWIDPLVAFVCGIVALVYGIFSLVRLCRKGVPICSCKFWLTSRGEGSKNLPSSMSTTSDSGDLEMNENNTKSGEGEENGTKLSTEVV